jgi:hypothetical protein
LSVLTLLFGFSINCCANPLKESEKKYLKIDNRQVCEGKYVETKGR